MFKTNIRFIAPYSIPGVQGAFLSDVIQYLDKKKKEKGTITIDTETTGLDPHQSDVVMLQLGDDDIQFVIDTRFVCISPLTPYLESDDITKVLVNAKFDIKMLLTNFDIRLRCIFDSMLMELIIQNGKERKASLAQLAAKYLNFHFAEWDVKVKGRKKKLVQLSLFGEPMVKSIGKEFLEVGDKPFTYNQVLYGALDVIIPYLVHKKQIDILKRDDLMTCAKVENLFTEALAEIEANGFYLSEEKWLDLANRNKSRLSWFKYLLKEDLMSLGKYELYKDINWDSPKQVTPLFKEIGINTQVIDKKKSLHSDEPIYKDTLQKYHIIKYQKKYPIVRHYLQYKLYKKATGTYGSKFLKHINPVTGRVHSTFWQIKNTGRVSSSNPNLQNIPSIKEFRYCFVPQHDDWILIAGDYSSQEGRIMADASRDKVMIDFFLNGDGDLHSFTAKKIFGSKFKGKHKSPELRFRAKVLNFSIAFGISAYKLHKDLGISKEEAQGLIDSWLNTYPGLKKFFKDKKKYSLKNGYVVIDNVTKRRFYFPKFKLFKELEYLRKKYMGYGWKIPTIWNKYYYMIKGTIERASQNYPIQGTAASMTKLAVYLLFDWIRENDLFSKIKIVNIVHDEIVLEVHKDYADLAAKKLKEYSEKAGTYLCAYVPMIANPKITDRWEH